jgi:hypothetical protein
MHYHEEIELNFDASCQQILGLESESLWEARSTPTLGAAPRNQPDPPFCTLDIKRGVRQIVSVTEHVDLCRPLCHEKFQHVCMGDDDEGSYKQKAAAAFFARLLYLNSL